MRYKWQKEILDTSPKRFGLWAGCRTGKSRAGVELAEQNGDSCVVITPKSLTINFEKEIKKWSKRKDYKWLVVSKETFKRDYKTYKGYDGVIIDEFHYFCSVKSQLHESLADYIKNKPKFIYGLTATPYRSKALDAYALAILLGFKINKSVFFNQCYRMIRMGNRMIPVEKKCARNVVEKVLKKIGRFVSLEEVTGYAPKTMEVNEYFDLTAEQKKAINDMVDILPVVRMSKIFQIYGGVVKSDGYSDIKYCKSEKLNRAKELIKDHNKIVFVCHYLLEMDLLKKAFGKNAHILNGSLSKQERDDVINEAEQSDKFILIIQADMCEGYSLKSFDFMVFYSMSWKAINYIQMTSRIIAVDKDTPVEYIHFITKDTYEEKLYTTVVEDKVDFIVNQLYENT